MPERLRKALLGPEGVPEQLLQKRLMDHFQVRFYEIDDLWQEDVLYAFMIWEQEKELAKQVADRPPRT